MNEAKAVKIAVECIEKEMRKIIIEANLALQGSTSAYHLRCQKRYIEMAQAIETLEAMAKQKRLF